MGPLFAFVLAVDPGVLTAILAPAGVFVGALVTYLLGARARSGKITHTEAETLWEEATAMRTMYRDEAISLRGEVGGLRGDVQTLRLEALRWQEEALHLRAQMAVDKGVRPGDLNTPAAIGAVQDVLDDTTQHDVRSREGS